MCVINTKKKTVQLCLLKFDILSGLQTSALNLFNSALEEDWQEFFKKIWPTLNKIVILPFLFGHFGPKFGLQFLFREFYLYQMLGIVASYPSMEFLGKLMNLTYENGNKCSFGPNFGFFGTNLVPKIFLRFISTRCYTLLQAIIVWNFREN